MVIGAGMGDKKIEFCKCNSCGTNYIYIAAKNEGNGTVVVDTSKDRVLSIKTG